MRYNQDLKTHGMVAIVYRDAWSDLVGSGLNSIGITPQIRDQAQPVIDYGKNMVMPKGGAIPDPSAADNVGSAWVSTGYKYVSNMNPLMIVGGVVILVAGYYLWKKA